MTMITAGEYGVRTMALPKKSNKRSSGIKPQNKNSSSNRPKLMPLESVEEPRSRKGFPQDLADYLKTAQSLTNESGKSQHFSLFLQRRFHLESDFISQYVQGLEKELKVSNHDKIIRGRADSLFGHLIIEFKNKLPLSLVDAEEQLKKYVAILWSKEKPDIRTPYIGIATDGIRFSVYSPGADRNKNELKPEEITLKKIDEVDWRKLNPDDIWSWLDRYFLRAEPMVPQTETIVRDFGIDSHVFRVVTEVLNACWHSIKHQSTFAVVYESWEKYLRIVYGEPVGVDDLFIRHTYLATFAKLLSWVHLEEVTQTPSDEDIYDVISGEFFKKSGIQNFIEEDFFSWIMRNGAKSDGIMIVKWILSVLRKYDLSRLSEDVMKSLYQELVDPQTRKYLGEFYTPDWLASMMVNNSLHNNGHASIIDPTCGSGTFLYLAIMRKRQLLPDTQHTLTHILDSVCGIDIHPLAVIIAKTNYILALGTLLSSRTEPIRIPVYLSDSIRLPAKEQLSVFVQVPSFKVTLDGHEVFIPEDFVNEQKLYDQTIELARDYAWDYKDTPVDIKSFTRFLQRNNYPRFMDANFTRAAFKIAEKLKHFIVIERDSIWSYILKNIYKPLFLKNQFDYVLGNPPWLRYSDMEPVLQKSLKELMAQYKLSSGKGQLMTAMEAATLFFLRTADLYLKEGGEIALVLPRSIFSSDHHDPLRRREFKFVENTEETLVWKEIWDLEGIQPLFNNLSCVLRATRIQSNSIKTTCATPASVYQGRLPGRNLRLTEAQKHLSVTSQQISLHFMGKRSYWSEGLAAANHERSPYYDLFGEGATVVPRSCWFIEIIPTKLGFDPNRPPVNSDAKAGAKKPFIGVSIKGNVEKQFLFGTLTGSEIVPFGHAAMRAVILPIVREHKTSVMIDSSKALTEGYRDLAGWLKQVESVWKEKRGSKTDRMSIYERINHNSGITRQNPEAKFRVVFNNQGANVSATVVAYHKELIAELGGRKMTLSGFIADYKLSYFETDSLLEAHYLSAVLNAPLLNKLIKPMMTKGAFGHRDIHKRPFELPIPRFDALNEDHLRLAALSASATKVIKAWLNTPAVLQVKAIGKKRSIARSAISSELAEIDNIVKRLLNI